MTTRPAKLHPLVSVSTCSSLCVNNHNHNHNHTLTSSSCMHSLTDSHHNGSLHTQTTFLHSLYCATVNYWVWITSGFRQGKSAAEFGADENYNCGILDPRKLAIISELRWVEVGGRVDEDIIASRRSRDKHSPSPRVSLGSYSRQLQCILKDTVKTDSH